MSSRINKLKKQIIVKEALNLINQNNYKESIDLFTKAIQLDSNDWRLFVNRSYCWQQLKQFNQALNDANNAIELNHNQISAHYRKGCILLNLKLFRSAEKAFKDALNCDPNDENSKLKLTETLQLFIKEFGFNSEREVNQLTQLFETCSAFSDALISGHLFDVYDFGNDSLLSYESARKIPDESDLIKSISISSEFNFHLDNDHIDVEEEDKSGFIPLVDSNDNSLVDVNSISSENSINPDLIRWQTPDMMEKQINDGNDSMSGIRIPKSVPLFRKSCLDINNDCKNIPIIVEKSPEVNTLINGSIDDSINNSINSSKESTPKKIVKTRPSIRISITH